MHISMTGTKLSVEEKDTIVGTQKAEISAPHKPVVVNKYPGKNFSIFSMARRTDIFPYSTQSMVP